jgi:hypothetical protein
VNALVPNSSMTQSLRAAQRRALVPLVTMFAQRGNARAVARLLRWAVVPLSSGARQAETVLVLPKEGFTEDALAALGADPRFRVVALARDYVKAVCAAFLPASIDDNTYRSAGAEYDAAKQRLRACWSAVWAEMSCAMPLGAVMTGNFGYFAEQELAAAVSAAGVPFIALHKEALKTPGRRALFEKLYRERRQPFAGSRILVYNRLERDLQVSAGSVAPERVTVCGMPRLDRMHAWRRASAGKTSTGRPCVLMFAFHEKTGLPIIPRKGFFHETADAATAGYAWTNLVRAFNEVAVRIAHDNPDIDVVVKTKSSLERSLVMLGGEAYDFGRHANLTVAAGGDPFAAITRADVVCGFITTALFESLAAGRPVVMPRFAEAAEPWAASYVLDLGGAVELARSADELAASLCATARRRTPVSASLSPDAARELQTWTGNADGAASARVAAAVWSEIAA